jgi:hypothetical protein
MPPLSLSLFVPTLIFIRLRIVYSILDKKQAIQLIQILLAKWGKQMDKEQEVCSHASRPERKDDQRAGERSTKTMSLHPTATPPVPEEKARASHFPTDQTTMKHC